MSRFSIPFSLKVNVTARLRQTGMSNKEAVRRYNQFAKWFKSHVRENRLTQKEYSLLAETFEDAGIQKRVKSKGQKRQSLNLSHLREYHPSSNDKPGSGLNFLENWYLNQRRGNKKLLQISEETLKIFPGLAKNDEKLSDVFASSDYIKVIYAINKNKDFVGYEAKNGSIKILINEIK